MFVFNIEHYLVLSEFANDWLMQKKANVFEKVKCSRRCGALVHFLLVLGFVRINAFKNAQSSEKQNKSHVLDNRRCKAAGLTSTM